jgi:hypothetical protein
MSCAPPASWHRNHARTALKTALQPTLVSPRSPPPPATEGRGGCHCSADGVLDGAGNAGRQAAGADMERTGGHLGSFWELVIEETAALLISSAATIDGRLAPERRKQQLKGRAIVKPGSLLKRLDSVRTWAALDAARPGFVEIDLLSHDGGNAAGQFAFTLTVTDIAAGWTENRWLPSTAANSVLNGRAYKMPFPILGVDFDNGPEFINVCLLQWCENTRSPLPARPADKNDGCGVEQKNWAAVRTVFGLPPLRHCRRPVVIQRDLATAVQADQLLLSAAERDIQVGDGAKVSKKYAPRPPRFTA